ncbi:MAG: hypothetical protein PHC34_10505 [Candidatus Gastranaerophilales bacterium]|nr:hypothetical protein [Candidatus Gastranaerophilales bacterium]
MEINDIIKEFFSNIKCTQCHNFFDKESINLVRHEHNYTVVRIICSKCGKNIGIAMLGLDKDSMKVSVDKTNEQKKPDDIPLELSDTIDPITYDDVIDAHKFFYSLGNDWSKHLPNKDA